jgi:hypothetical protein
MNTGATELPRVDPQEIERMTADYCRLAYEKKAMPHGMFEDPYIVCPWSGCGFRITGVDFHIERMGNPPFYAQVIQGWWLGPGIAARRPGCGNYVHFSVGKKQTVADPLAAGLVTLPDNWHQIAFLTHG